MKIKIRPTGAKKTFIATLTELESSSKSVRKKKEEDETPEIFSHPKKSGSLWVLGEIFSSSLARRGSSFFHSKAKATKRSRRKKAFAILALD